MATLVWRDGRGAKRTFTIAKSITTIGADLANDLVFADAGLKKHHAQIVFDGRSFAISGMEDKSPIEINGKSRRKSKLGQDNRIRLGEVELRFSLLASPLGNGDDGSENDGYALEGLRQLQQFSANLMAQPQLSDILKELMDAVVDLTGASKGFLVLFEDDRPEVKVARNMHREDVENAVHELSDSIVSRVVETGKPLIISDAMNDSVFASAESVINLQINSVMCVPLLERGRLLGLIYVGNESVKGLFENRTLDLLSIFAAQASMLVQNALLLDELRVQNQSLSDELQKQRFGEIIGASPAMKQIFAKVEKLAGVDVSVLIGGETGTGKELIAREIHRRGPRANGPFVSVNCGAIPVNLMESEFFGHVRGAFTGAVSNSDGKFRAAEKGTIFLDEIGEMPLELQVKILRVLQERQVTKVGATKLEAVDIRVIAASNRNLEDEVTAGRFREDLFYRLNVVHIDLPPLRERGDDVVLIARYLLRGYAEEYNSAVNGFTPDAVVAMKKHPWPGNVRELENRIKKAIILCDGTMLGQGDLDLDGSALPEPMSLAEAREKFQRDYVLAALERNDGNRTKTARDLDVDPRTVFRYLEKA